MTVEDCLNGILQLAGAGGRALVLLGLEELSDDPTAPEKTGRGAGRGGGWGFWPAYGVRRWRDRP